MNCEQTMPGVLPETEDILSLLRRLDVHPRALPETHEILTLLSQLYRPAPSRLPLQPVLSAEAVRQEVPPAVPPAPDVLWLPVTAFFERARWDGAAPHTAPVQIVAMAEQQSDTGLTANIAATSLNVRSGDQLDKAKSGILASDLSLSTRAFFEAVRWDAPKRGAASDEPPHQTPAPKHEATGQLSPAKAAPSPVAIVRHPSSGQRQLSVSDFFAQVAWDGRRPERQHAGESPGNLAAPQNGKLPVGPVALPLQPTVSPGSARQEFVLVSQPSSAPDASDLSVAAFFERVQWDGKARGATADLLPNQIAPQNSTVGARLPAPGAAPIATAAERQPDGDKKKLAVSAFFAQVTWDGHRPALQRASQSPGAPVAPQNGWASVSLQTPPLDQVSETLA